MDLPAPTYAVRKDIEGLRALAVLAVVAGHTIRTALRGGFCGVDVFFVISGYLIGKHLLEDIHTGRFSFLRFYARRARRLLPALVLVLTAVWGVGWVILSAPELAALGRHIAAASVFSNNFLLWSESGYFDAVSTSKPLLHLWSLGIEEQFYLLVPLLLWLGARGRQGSVRWVMWLSVGSLLLTELQLAPSFYLLDARFWELGAGVMIGYLSLHEATLGRGTPALGKRGYREILAGALLLTFAAALRCGVQQWDAGLLGASSGVGALLVLGTSAAQLAGTYRRPTAWERLARACRRHEGVLRDGVAALGIAIVVASFFALTSADWPGPQTLLPVLGTALIIGAGPSARVNRFLAWRPLVYVGGISYPLYLWHWPALVFWRMLVPDTSLVVVPVGASLLLAWVTRELVENPARFGRLCGATVRRPPVWVLFAALVTTGLIGISAVATSGYPTRFSPALRAIANWPVPPVDWRVHRCYFNPGESQPFAPECTPARRPGIARVLLWGDSHAADLYPGLLKLQKRHNFDVIQWTAASCPPTREALPVEGRGCAERRAWALGEMTAAPPETVLLAGAWELYLARDSSEKEILGVTRDAIRYLKQVGVRHIIVFGPGPTWNTSLPTDLFRYMRLGHTLPIRFGSVAADVRRLDAAMAAEVAASGGQFVSILDLLCNLHGCRVQGEEGREPPDLLFWDRDHLTQSGSRWLMDAAAPLMFAGEPAGF
jgi:peptidoglycan/LPS O-acetylase OafA/YrhL